MKKEEGPIVSILLLAIIFALTSLIPVPKLNKGFEVMKEKGYAAYEKLTTRPHIINK